MSHKSLSDNILWTCGGIIRNSGTEFAVVIDNLAPHQASKRHPAQRPDMTLPQDLLESPSAHSHHTKLEGCWPLFLLIGLVAGCSEPRSAHQRAIPITLPVGEPELVVTILDTLRTGDGAVLADPIGIFEDRLGRYLAVDRSDKDIKVYGDDGEFTSTIGRPGSGPGEFEVLWGGGVTRGDSVFGYDFADLSVEMFDANGTVGRTFSIGDGFLVPSSVASFGHNALLVSYFPLGATANDLLHVVDLHSHAGPRFANFAHYLEGAPPAVLQESIVHADAHAGLVVVGMRGYDSIAAYTDDGKRIAAMRLPDDLVASTYRRAIESRGGDAQRADGTFVTDSIEAVTSILVIDGSTALVQIASVDAISPLVDLTAGGNYLVVLVDQAAQVMRVVSIGRKSWGLIGRHQSGDALLARYVGALYDAVEIASARVHYRMATNE